MASAATVPSLESEPGSGLTSGFFVLLLILICHFYVVIQYLNLKGKSAVSERARITLNERLQDMDTTVIKMREALRTAHESLLEERRDRKITEARRSPCFDDQITLVDFTEV